jgi:hypothetical protein
MHKLFLKNSLKIIKPNFVCVCEAIIQIRNEFCFVTNFFFFCFFLHYHLVNLDVKRKNQDLQGRSC